MKIRRYGTFHQKCRAVRTLFYRIFGSLNSHELQDAGQNIIIHPGFFVHSPCCAYCWQFSGYLSLHSLLEAKHIDTQKQHPQTNLKSTSQNHYEHKVPLGFAWSTALICSRRNHCHKRECIIIILKLTPQG